MFLTRNKAGLIGSFDKQVSGVYNLDQVQIGRVHNLWALPPDSLLLHLDANSKYYGEPNVFNVILNTAHGFNNYESSNVTYVSSTSTSLCYYSFNGTNGVLNPQTPLNGNDDFDWTQSVWFYSTSSSGRKIFGYEEVRQGTTAASYDKHLAHSINGKLVWGQWTGALRFMSSNTTVTINNWHHAVITYDYTNNRAGMWLDGVFQTSITSIRGQDSTRFLRFGGYGMGTNWRVTGPNLNNGYFSGNVSIFSMWQKVLTTSEILQVFAAHRGLHGI